MHIFGHSKGEGGLKFTRRSFSEGGHTFIRHSFSVSPLLVFFTNKHKYFYYNKLKTDFYHYI